MRGKFFLCGSLVALSACESVRHAQPVPAPPAARGAPVVARPVPPAPPADVLRASARVPAAPQTAPYDPLARAAECVSRNELAAAATHLEAHLRAHPDQPLYRLQLADLHTRTANTDAATEHLERFVCDARSPALRKYLPDAHTKLMGLAQARGDRFAELLHRGAGLLELLTELDADPERDAAFCEEVLCKALRALADAKALKPTDPRARLALADAYARSGNAKGAAAERAAARTNAGLGELTPAESARLGLE